MKNNILFYFRYPFLPTSGGVERVSCVLGDWLTSQGYKVYYLSDIFGGQPNPIFIHNEAGLSDDENFDSLKRFVREKSIKVIINQGAFFPSSMRLFELRVFGIKIISVFHNSLDAMYSHPPIPSKFSFLRGVLNTRFFKCVFKLYFYLKYHGLLKNIVLKSERVVVLSKHYFQEIEKYACKSDNIVAIGNPLTLPLAPNVFEKENAVCFLGRLSWQKRPDLLLKIWSKVPNKRDWHLYIIGDGEMRKELEEQIKHDHIQNVSLEGYQNPVPYLKRSKILCMTSMYEGFPLVLFEGMCYGVVPIVFDSFGSAKDIINDGQNGYLVSCGDINQYASKIIDLMEYKEKWNIFSFNARECASRNSIENVGPYWIKLLNSLV